MNLVVLNMALLELVDLKKTGFIFLGTPFFTFIFIGFIFIRFTFVGFIFLVVTNLTFASALNRFNLASLLFVAFLSTFLEYGLITVDLSHLLNLMIFFPFGLFGIANNFDLLRGTFGKTFGRIFGSLAVRISIRLLRYVSVM